MPKRIEEYAAAELKPQSLKEPDREDSDDDMGPEWGDWKCGSGKCDTVKIARVENAGVSRMERQPEIILRQS